MDWLKKIPIGQYVSGKSSWLRGIDPRIKLSWILLFLLTPILANSLWRISTAFVLLLITFLSFLPPRIWWRSLVFLLAFSLIIGSLSIVLPASQSSFELPIRASDEIPGAIVLTRSWEIFRLGPFNFGGISLGPLIVDRRSAELGIKTSTLIFTVIHSVNLMLLTTLQEDIVWALSWFMYPLRKTGLAAKILLQVHDELVLEVDPKDLEETKLLVQNTMENAVKLSVPLIVETGVGVNWMEAK